MPKKTRRKTKARAPAPLRSWERENERLLIATKMAPRLRAAMTVLGMRTQGEFAAYLEEDRTTLNHWLNSGFVPPLPAMLRLKRKSGVTLDWLYDGDASGMPEKLLIHLQGILGGHAVPVLRQEPAGAPGLPDLALVLRKRRGAGTEPANGNA